MSSVIVGHCNDDTFSYFKIPYNKKLNYLIREVIPSEDRDVTEGLGWNKTLKIWVFPQKHHVTIESLVAQCFDSIFWQEKQTLEDLVGMHNG